MDEVVLNGLGPDGMREVKILSDVPPVSAVWQWERGLPAMALERLRLDEQCDEALGLYSAELRWPVFEPIDVINFGPRRFRRLMMVSYVYAARVSECIGLAAESFFAGTHFRPRFAFVRELPKGAEDGMEIDGVMLMEAEWMPSRCVAVGGRG